MVLQGTVQTVGPIEEKGAKNFKICKIMLDRTTTHQGQTYPNFTEITLIGKKTDMVKEKNIAVGDYITVKGDLNGRFFTNKEGGESHAQDFQVWAIEMTRKLQTNEAKTEDKATAQTDVYGQTNS